MKKSLIIVVGMNLILGPAQGTPVWAEDNSATLMFAQKQGSYRDPFEDLDEEFPTLAVQEEDPFKNLEQELAREPDSDTRKTSFFADMVESFKGQASTRVMGHYHEVREQGIDDKRVFVEGKLDFKTKVIRDRYMFNCSGWIEAGNQDDTYAGVWDPIQDTNRRRRYFEIKELDLILIQESLDVTVGWRPFPLGISTLYVPSDRISPRDLNDPLNPKELSLLQAILDVYDGTSTYTLGFFPFFSPSKAMANSSRWIGYPDSFYFADIGEVGEGKQQFPDKAPKNFEYLARFKTVYRGWDLFLAAFHGISPFPVLSREQRADSTKVGVQEWIRVLNLSAGFSTTYKKFEFHGELLGQYAYDGKDDDYINYVGGFTFTLDEWVKWFWLDRVDLTLEYAGEYLIAEQSKKGYVRSSEDSRTGQDDIIGRLLLKFNEDLIAHYLFHIDLDNEGRMQRIGADYRILDNWTVKVASEFFNGPDDSYYGRWGNNDRFIATVEYRF